MRFEGVIALVLAVNLVCALVCSFLASRSGRDPFGWVLAGGVLGPFALVALLASGQRVGGGARPAGPSEVLLPTDGSESSLAAVAHVIAVRPKIGSVTLLAVLPLERQDGAKSQPGSPVRRLYDEDVESHTGEAQRRLGAAAIPCGVVVRFGDPASEILRLAQEDRFGQIVMGRRGRGGVAKLLLGSVSERVVKGAQVPVTLAG